METLNCPLCSTSVEPSSLEAHLRFDLRLPLLACRLCPDTFCDRADAAKHFSGSFAEHPGMQPQLIKPPSDSEKETRLLELLRLARGGPDTIEQRLCVCGQCRLLCRKDVQAAAFSPRPHHYPVKTSPDSENQSSAEQYREEDSPDTAFRFVVDADGVEGNADQDSNRIVRKHLEEEEEEEDPAFRFAKDIGPLQPNQFITPTSGHQWPGTKDSETSENMDPRVEQSRWPTSEDEVPANEFNPAEKQWPLESENEEDPDQRIDAHPIWQPIIQQAPTATEEESNPNTNTVGRHAAMERFSATAPWKKSNDGTENGRNDRLTMPTEPQSTSAILDRMLIRKSTTVNRKQDNKPPMKNDTISLGKELRCGSCSKAVRRKDAREHASRFHLKKPLYKCKSCDFSSSRANVGTVNRHVRKVHGQAPGPEAVDASGLHRHAEAIDAMVRKLFGL